MKLGDAKYDAMVAEALEEKLRMHKVTQLSPEQCAEEIKEITGIGGSTQINPVGHEYGSDIKSGDGLPGITEGAIDSAVEIIKEKGVKADSDGMIGFDANGSPIDIPREMHDRLQHAIVDMAQAVGETPILNSVIKRKPGRPKGSRNKPKP